MKSKVIAFYLPQYHEIPENNVWWGEGFTEWTNVKKGKPLFKTHYQPKIPYGKKYYCLLDSKIQEWQSEIALEAGIYGFCYYHYWFNGKLLLEKPAENMLKNSKIKIKFCMSWANEPWTKTWTGKNKEVLMPQRYGGEDEWRKHLEYLLPFFKDSRYILRNNRPVFLIYRAENVYKCDEMIKYWEKILIKEGFDGIYIIETLTGWQNESMLKYSNGVAAMEPMYCFSKDISFVERKWHTVINKAKLHYFHIYNFYDYDRVWEKILAKKILAYKDVFMEHFWIGIILLEEGKKQ